MRDQPSLPSFVEITTPDSEVVAHHLACWNLVPPHTIRVLRASGVRIWIGEGPVAGFAGYERYRTMQPRGWPEGSMLEMVSGMYDRGAKVVVVGGWADELGIELLHEIGHAVGHGTGMDDSEAIIRQHVRLFERLDGYLQQIESRSRNHLPNGSLNLLLSASLTIPCQSAPSNRRRVLYSPPCPTTP